jgi:hypothetical protein
MAEALPSVLALGTMAAAAVWLTISRGGVAAGDAVVRSAVRAAAVAIAAQAGHFVEELATGFNERFPEVFGLAPLSPSLFVAFNVAWLAIWAVSAGGLARRRRLALFPLWFLAIAGVANGLAHPLLALRAGGYFPGLAASPLVAVAGALLLVRLSRVTA